MPSNSRALRKTPELLLGFPVAAFGLASLAEIAPIHVLSCSLAEEVRTAMGWGVASRGRYATPTDSPPHGGTPYRGLRVRRWGLGFVHRSRAIFCRAVPDPNVSIRNVVSLQEGQLQRPQRRRSMPAREASRLRDARVSMGSLTLARMPSSSLAVDTAQVEAPAARSI